MKKFTFIIGLLLLTFSIFAQSSGIKGYVKDAQGKGVDLALVVLKNLPDSTIIQSKYCDQEGFFSFSSVIETKFLLQVNMFGYDEYTMVINTLETKGDIQISLIESSESLSNVTISATKSWVERKLDRIIVNPEAIISNAGANAIEAIEKAPGILVDVNGNIQLKGRSGVSVYVDDKPLNLSGTELENYLKSLPASSIQRIEIMTNPPAKYEAAGNAGVINIVTKRSTLSGTHGNVSLALTQGRYTRSNNSLNLNHNTNKIALYAQLGAGIRYSFQDLNINRYYRTDGGLPDGSFTQNSFIVKDAKSANARVGIDYYANAKTTLGFSSKFMGQPNGDKTDNTAFVRDAQNMLSNRVIADNTTRNRFDNVAYNAYLRRSIDSLGSTISGDIDYVQYGTSANQIFKNDIFDPSNNRIYTDTIDGRLPANINIYTAKVDYLKLQKSGIKWEAGVKTAFTSTDNEAIYFKTLKGVRTKDNTLSNRFLYDEWIHSGYVNHSRKIGKIDAQIGLRTETTSLSGQQLGNEIKPDTSFTREYTNIFPTFYASWQGDSLGDHVWVLDFGRRIDRPYFQDLNPFVSPLDKFTFYSGNPNLLPTYSYNTSLTWSYKSKYNTTLSYNLTTDGINETLEIIKGIYYSRPNNITTQHTFGLSFDTGIQLTPWYRINASSNLMYFIFKSPLYTEFIDTSSIFWMANVIQNFSLGRGWNAELRTDYNSDVIVAQLLIKSWGTVNVALQKKILKDKGTFKISLNDLFYTRRADGIIYNLNNTNADWDSTLDTRSATVSFSYRIGTNTSKKPKHNSNGSEAETSRVKS